MRQHSNDPQYWEAFCESYGGRLMALKLAVPNCEEIDAHEIIQGHYEPLAALCVSLGLIWREDVAADFIEPTYWGNTK